MFPEIDFGWDMFPDIDFGWDIFPDIDFGWDIIPDIDLDAHIAFENADFGLFSLVRLLLRAVIGGLE